MRDLDLQCRNLMPAVELGGEMRRGVVVCGLFRVVCVWLGLVCGIFKVICGVVCGWIEDVLGVVKCDCGGD